MPYSYSILFQQTEYKLKQGHCDPSCLHEVDYYTDCLCLVLGYTAMFLKVISVSCYSIDNVYMLRCPIGTIRRIHSFVGFTQF